MKALRDIPAYAVPRKMLRIGLATDERMMFDALGRAYGIVGEDGAVRTPELCRLLMVVGISPSAPPRVTAAVAARINAKMVVARVGKLLAVPFGAMQGDGPGSADPNRRIHVTLDASLLDQVLRFVQNVADPYNGHGKIMASRVIHEMISRGLRDPRIGAVMAAYAPWINTFIARLSKMQGDIRAMLAELVPALEGVAA